MFYYVKIGQMKEKIKYANSIDWPEPLPKRIPIGHVPLTPQPDQNATIVKISKKELIEQPLHCQNHSSTK
jgi:hypothetical protein